VLLSEVKQLQYKYRAGGVAPLRQDRTSRHVQLWKEQVKGPSVFRAQMMSLVATNQWWNRELQCLICQTAYSIWHQGIKQLKKKKVEVCQRRDILSTCAIILIRSKGWAVLLILSELSTLTQK